MSSIKISLFPAASRSLGGSSANLVSGGIFQWDILSQTTFPYSGEEFFSGGATL